MGVDLVTFGCRLNTLESEAMRAAAEAAGADCDVVIVNTCAVTAEAARQARQTIRRIGRERPDARIIVTGCAAQVEPESFAAMAEVAHVVGNDEKTRAETWQRLLAPGADEAPERLVISDIMSVRETAGHLVDGLKGRARAFVQVQNGCDHRCTFCIIPYGRGNSRSVPMGAVVEQVRRLVDNGAREVVVTGVDITSYGHDLPGSPSLGRLVQAILKHVPDLPRLRLSSIDSVEIDDALIETIAGEARLMPHLHLSLQAGDDLILKRMKRRHLREDAIRVCAELRASRPDLVFGADLIAGFPTETETMFANTLDLVEACGLTHLHVFPFSPRPGTPAAKMPPVARAVVKERAARLRAKGEEAYRTHLRAEIGQIRHALMETETLGRTEGFTLVHMAAPQKPGDIVPVTIRGENGETLLADPAASASRAA